MKAMILFAVLFSLQTRAETTSSISPQQEKDQQQLTLLLDEIDQLNKDVSCKKTKHCVALAMGNAPCGGPQYYIVASEKNKKIKELKEKAQKHVRLSEEFNKNHRPGMMGICRMAMPPSMSCRQNRCKAQEQ